MLIEHNWQQPTIITLKKKIENVHCTKEPFYDAYCTAVKKLQHRFIPLTVHGRGYFVFFNVCSSDVGLSCPDATASLRQVYQTVEAARCLGVKFYAVEMQHAGETFGETFGIRSSYATGGLSFATAVDLLQLVLRRCVRCTSPAGAQETMAFMLKKKRQ